MDREGEEEGGNDDDLGAKDERIPGQGGADGLFKTGEGLELGLDGRQCWGLVKLVLSGQSARQSGWGAGGAERPPPSSPSNSRSTRSEMLNGCLAPPISGGVA